MTGPKGEAAVSERGTRQEGKWGRPGLVPGSPATCLVPRVSQEGPWPCLPLAP